MLSSFRKLKIGFVNLTLEHLEKEDKEEATKYVDYTKKYLESELNVDLIDYKEAIFRLEQATKAWKYLQANDIDAVIVFNGTFNTADLTVEIARNLEIPYLFPH